LILYSKKEGIGYLSPFGNEDEGSDVLLSTMGCFVIIGSDGLPALIIFGIVVVVEKLILCIGSNIKRLCNSISSGHKMPLTSYD
jgi:hypothetical protein